MICCFLWKLIGLSEMLDPKNPYKCTKFIALSQFWTMTGYMKGCGCHIGGHFGVHHSFRFILFFYPTNDSNGFLDPKKPRNRHQIYRSRTIPHGVIMVIMMRLPSWTPSWITPFRTTSGLSTHFFNLLLVPYTDQESKLRNIWLHTGLPSVPGL